MSHSLIAEAAWLPQCIEFCKSFHEDYTCYCSSVSSPADTTGELESLLATLESLDSTLKTRQFEQGEEDQFDTVRPSISNCEGIFNELQDERNKICITVGNAANDVHPISDRGAAYPFRQSTAQRLRGIVDDLQGRVSSVLNALNPKYQKAVNDDDDDLTGPEALSHHMNIPGRSFMFEEWLPTVHATIDHRAVYGKRHKGTGLWFRKSRPFQEWLARENSFLWLNGSAGCGKSVICSTAIQSTFCQQQQQQHMLDVGIAFFYFSSAEISKQGTSAMFREILLQLERQQPIYSERLASEILYKKYEPTGPPETELFDSLRASIQTFRHAFIFLDGIDENPLDGSRTGVLIALNKMRDWGLPNFHLLITSCNVPDIRSSLNISPNEDVPLRNDAINQDISKYIAFEITNDAKLQRWKQHQSRIQRALTEHSQGVFRYAECQLEALKQCPRTRYHLEERLRSLPRHLDETYERLFSNIDNDYINDTRCIMSLLCFSGRPLLVEELADAYAVDIKNVCLDPDRQTLDIESIRELCHGLVQTVTISDSENRGRAKSTVCIAHSSLRKYLISEQMRQSKSARVFFQDDIAHAEMAQTCLIYLLDPELRTGDVDEKKLEAFPLAHYAAKYWFHHYQHARSMDTQVESLILELFRYQRTAFDRWVELHDIDGLWEIIYDADPTSAGPLSPVYFASYLGLGWVLQDLLEGMEEDEGGSDLVGRGLANALQIASWKGHKGIIQMLLDNGANVNASSEWCGTALQAASRNGHQKAVQMLLDHGADVNAPGVVYETALYTAAAHGHAPVVQMLLDWGIGATIDDHNRVINRALQVAASRCHTNVVQMLINMGADISHKRGPRGNALEVASRQGNEEVVRLLLANGADVNAYGGLYGNPLCNSGLSGNSQVVQMLLDHGADVNAGSFSILGTPLMWATNEEDNGKVVELLLQRGARVNDQGGTRGNALQNACIKGNERVVRLLIDWGADVNARSEAQGTALQVAAQHGATDAVRMLLDMGADVNAPAGPNGTALEAALYAEAEEIVRMLRAAGAKPSKYGKL